MAHFWNFVRLHLGSLTNLFSASALPASEGLEEVLEEVVNRQGALALGATV